MSTASTEPSAAAPPIRLKDLSSEQWKSGVAAWLGWLFDGMDMHLYTMAAGPFVALLLSTIPGDRNVQVKSSLIQGAFLVGWALGGTFFGLIGDKLGRSRALSLTILTYAAFTGMSSFAHNWQQLLIFRFISALGIGGEWAVGSALLAETWPSRWRPWVAAMLQSGVNIGVLLAAATYYGFASFSIDVRWVFLVGIGPALLVFWIRKNVPEPEEWLAARREHRPVHAVAKGSALDLFRGSIKWITIRAIIVCACGLTSWWAFMFWINQHLPKLPDIAGWADADKKRLVAINFSLLIGISIPGNFFAGWLAKLFGYRRAIAFMMTAFLLTMVGAFFKPRAHVDLMAWCTAIGFCSGVWGLFTMYLPPLFPTLLRTTGAGFSYNVGRLAAAFGTIYFGLFAKVSDFRPMLLANGFLFVPAILVALTLPELKDE